MKRMYAQKKGHFTGDTVIVSALAAGVAYYLIERFKMRKVKHENALRLRK